MKGFFAALSAVCCLTGLVVAGPLAAQDAAPASPDALYQFALAKLLAVEGSVTEALAAYEEAERLAPASPYVRLEHAQLLARLAQYSRSPKTREDYLRKAAQGIDEARKLAPENVDVLRAAGSIYLDLAVHEPGALATAQQALEEALRRDPMDASSALTLGQLYLDQRQPEKASQVLRDLVSRVPQQRMAYALLVEALLRTDKKKEAEDALREILQGDPGSLEARLTLADLQGQRDDHRAAIETLSAAPEEVRDEPRLRRKLAWELYLTGDLEGALKTADLLLTGGEPGDPGGAGDPEAESMRLLKGMILSAEGRNREALDLLGKFQQAQPGNPALASAVSRLLQREKRYAEAAGVLSALADELAREGKTAEEQEARLDLAQVYFEAKDWEQAAKATAPLISSEDERVRVPAVVLQADALAEAERYDEALALLDEKGGQGPLAESRRAEVLLRAGREAEGREKLRALAESGDPTGPLAAAQAFHRRELYKDSIPILESAVAKQPDSAIGYFMLGAAFERAGQRAQAVAALRRALEIEPDFHAALNYLGYTLAEKGENLDEALSLAQRAVALDPDNGSYVDSLGWAYYQLGRHEQARGYLERAARLEPADATLQEHLGDVYVALGQNDRAREAYRRALELGEDNAEQVRRKLDGLGDSRPRPRP